MPARIEYQNHIDSSTEATTCCPEEEPGWGKFNTSSYGGKAKIKPDPKPRQWLELSYGGRILKNSVAVFGNQPRSGYPVYIGLHGDGTDKTGTDNDDSWWDAFDRYYRIPVENQTKVANGAVFVAARGVSSGSLEEGPVDTWDLHFQPESYSARNCDLQPTFICLSWSSQRSLFTLIDMVLELNDYKVFSPEAQLDLKGLPSPF